MKVAVLRYLAKFAANTWYSIAINSHAAVSTLKSKLGVVYQVLQKGEQAMKFAAFLQQSRLLCVLLAVTALPVCSQIEKKPPLEAVKNQPQESYFRDCTNIEFDEVDETLLTKEERIARQEAILEKSLNASAECMDDAMQAGMERMSAAKSGAEAGGAAGANQAAGSENSAQNQQTETQNQQAEQSQQQSSQQSSSSKAHQQGQGGGGSSAVCDAIKQGLASATTAAEKQHFQQLMKEYQCQ
ncbi:hypothetical protein ACFOEE_16080 [Pseudoalteromonas fenneropenaei]|uniref:Uncharacterized protein n=1 Tax=Pseudoalteromonas fenneropenaei TaxID=1737459 RepID=A0ABV7CN24_9GAMM